ncbi:hypothetical protein CIPAW_07G120400 [Carya illinoinensis]|uniref:Agenet domain-containing protein n=1 Tax=Carya illinoinensis TaxID=32201 RepID=A0A8T1Q4V2_CARIL|nr:hypothetical protein CIPAW_07G120400 [Carya illinoinensis]
MGCFESSCESESNHLFSLGTEVEVSSDEPGFKGSCYLATIIELPTPKKLKKARVEYRTLLTDDGSEQLKEYVDQACIRPLPPQEVAAQDLEHGEVVGAYCRDGWWTGVVVKVLGNSKYRVFFENPPDVIEFDRKDLRVHLEWVKGKWVRPEKRHANEDRIINQSEIRPRVVWKDGKWVSRYQEVLLAPDIQEHLRHAKTTSNPEGTVQVESSGGTKDDMGNETPLSANSIKNLIELSSPGDEKEAQYTLTQSTKKMKLPTTPQGNSTDSHPSKKLITRKTAGEMLFAAECKLRKQRKKISTEAVSRLDTANSGGKKTRHSEVDGNKPSAVDATEVWPKQQKHSQLDSEKTTPGKRKRRLSMKLKVKSPSSSASGGGTAKEIVCKGASKDTGMPIIIGLEAKGTGVSDSGNCGQLLDQKKNTNSPTEDRPMEIDQQKSGGNSIKRKRGRPRKVVVTDSKASEEGKEQNGAGGAADGTVKEDCPTQGVALDVLIGEKSADPHDVSTTNDVGSTSVATSGNMDDDDQPLSKWFVGMLHCPTSIKESKLSPGRTIDECEEAREQVDIVQQVPAADATACMLDENRRLPFVKSSPVWKAIESMEIFRIMPQNPHFLPLDKCKEEYREGLAIVVRGRINELLSIKDGQGRILSESKDVECKILHCNREKTEMAEEMANITEQMAELQKKQALIKSELRNKKQEISRLQIRVDAINRDIQSGRLDFEKVAAAPWKLG